MADTLDCDYWGFVNMDSLIFFRGFTRKLGHIPAVCGKVSAYLCGDVTMLMYWVYRVEKVLKLRADSAWMEVRLFAEAEFEKHHNVRGAGHCQGLARPDPVVPDAHRRIELVLRRVRGGSGSGSSRGGSGNGGGSGGAVGGVGGVGEAP
jgi:uncharacterized membrane protein YgcG